MKNYKVIVSGKMPENGGHAKITVNREFQDNHTVNYIRDCLAAQAEKNKKMLLSMGFKEENIKIHKTNKP